MHIDILIPLYNGIEFLDECLNSIKSQTISDWTVYIGVNGHGTNSDVYKEASKHNNGKIITYDMKTTGKSNTLNAMLSFCNDVVCLIDVDDKWHPEKLQHQIQYIGNYNVVGSLCQYFGNMTHQPHLPIGEISKHIFMDYNPIINSSSMFHKSDVYWSDSSVEDYELWLRLNYEGKKFFNVDKTLTYHRIHSNSYFNTKNHTNEINRVKQKWKI